MICSRNYIYWRLLRFSLLFGFGLVALGYQLFMTSHHLKSFVLQWNWKMHCFWFTWQINLALSHSESLSQILGNNPIYTIWWDGRLNTLCHVIKAKAWPCWSQICTTNGSITQHLPFLIWVSTDSWTCFHWLTSFWSITLYFICRSHVFSLTVYIKNAQRCIWYDLRVCQACVFERVVQLSFLLWGRLRSV